MLLKYLSRRKHLLEKTYNDIQLLINRFWVLIFQFVIQVLLDQAYRICSLKATLECRFHNAILVAASTFWLQSMILSL